MANTRPTRPPFSLHPTAPRTVDLWPCLLAAALLLFVADVAWRRLAR